MTYESEVQFKFDATYTHDYTVSHFGDDDFLPEEHFLITAPAGDLNCKQYFKLFEKFMLCVGMDPSSIRSGAMSFVFNDMVKEEEQRKVCKEYELTMDEDLEKKYQEYKERDEEWARLKNHDKENVVSSVIEARRFNPSVFEQLIGYTDEQLEMMIDMYEQSKYPF